MRSLILIILTFCLTTWNTYCFGQSPRKPEIKQTAPHFLEQGATKPYVSKAPSSLQDKLKQIGSGEAVLDLPAGTYEVTGNLAIPRNIHLKVEKGAVLDIANGVTLTLNCTIDAGPYQIFRWTGSGKVIFGRGATSGAYFRWWGTHGDGVGDDTRAVQAALNACETINAPELWGSPGDIYLCDTVTYRPGGFFQPGDVGTTHVLDGQGCCFRQKGTNNLLQFISHCRLQVKNLSLEGALRQVWYTTEVQHEPARVSFNGKAGTQKAQLLNLRAEKDWYWDRGTKRLYIYAFTYPSDKDPQDMYPQGGIQVDGGPALASWTRYLAGSGLYSGDFKGSCMLDVNNVTIKYFDKGLHLAYGLSSTFRNITILDVNYAVYAVPNNGKSHMNVFDHFTIGGVYNGPAVYLDGSKSITFSNSSLEYVRKQLFYLKNVHAANIYACLDEFGSFRSLEKGGASEIFLFDNVWATTVKNCSIWSNAPDSGVTAVFRMINNTGGINIEANHFLVYGNKKAAVISTNSDATVGGINFIGNQFFGNSKWCSEGDFPMVRWDNNTFQANRPWTISWVGMPISAVRLVKRNAHLPDYSGENPTFEKALQGPVTLNNGAKAAIDNTVGYDDSHSLKITWNGSGGRAEIKNIYRQPQSGTLSPVAILYMKSDTDQKVNLWVGFNKAENVPLKGDNQWRAYWFIGSQAKYPMIFDLKKLEVQAVDATKGNIWIDQARLYYFPTHAEACGFVGYDVSSKAR